MPPRSSIIRSKTSTGAASISSIPRPAISYWARFKAALRASESRASAEFAADVRRVLASAHDHVAGVDVLRVDVVRQLQDGFDVVDVMAVDGAVHHHRIAVRLE